MPRQAADAGDDENAGGNDVIAVSLPQLFELFATDFLVDFVKDIGHRPCPDTSPGSELTALPPQAPPRAELSEPRSDKT